MPINEQDCDGSLACQTVNSEIFCENFIFAKTAKRHICHIKSRLWLDLPTPVTDRKIYPFHEGILFAKAKMNPHEIFRIFRTTFELALGILELLEYSQNKKEGKDQE